jgi:hypothetical protein
LLVGKSCRLKRCTINVLFDDGDSSFVAEGNRNEFRITDFLLNFVEFFFY